ncbi:CsbD family protein [Phycicoccus sp. CSK15P-2]|uniref:CsbD family protein n=1 Tax=Phycicoccus sp. CSK15P-2 TaxID=2807627 RepID=UPI00194F84B8|nr:CsbD family protein [Phycicoccus sp. CSK15P-2]MBM6404354.1 CsbD family protein [Phycicoccus sp. CSK15P-2]
MGFDDKIENAKIDAEGKTKEAAGKATDDERLETEGKSKQAESDIRQAGEKVKDAFKH